MHTITQQLINGLSLGSIYALLALGYTMVYGVIKLINFAHGDIYMLGAFWGYYVLKFWHVNFFVALLSAMIISAAAGVVIEFLAYRPLRHSPRITALITAIGVSYLLENGMSAMFGASARNFPQAITQHNYHVGGIIVSNIQLLILAVAIVLMVALQLIIKKSKMGKAMRAVAVDPDAAQLMGINPNHVISFTFALGSALAGAAGVLIGLYYNSIDPLMGMTPGIKAFVAAGVLGIIDTVLQNFGALRMVIYALALILLMVFKPSGLLGRWELSFANVGRRKEVKS